LDREPRPDHASFTRKTEVQDTGKHGRGLFAAKDIKTGELVLCEKASEVVFNHEVEQADENPSPMHALEVKVAEKLRRNWDFAVEFAALAGDGFTALPLDSELVGGRVVVDL
jgi:hypothetical protein